MATTIDTDKLAKIVRKERKPALVLFFGRWCVDCKAFEPTWTKWNTRKSGPIFEVEIERGDEAWKSWDLEEIPTAAVFIGGREVDRAQGAISAGDLGRLWRWVSRERV